MNVIRLLLTVFIGLVATVAWPSLADERAVAPADLLVAVSRLTSDLELVRRELGKTKPSEVRFIVRSAEPRHVYFHAQTVFRKMNRLAQELAGVERLVPTPAPEGDIQSADVLGLLKQVQGQLEIVKLELDIRDVVAQPPRESRTKPRDVMQALVSASQRTSLLLTQPFEPEDVYRQLELSSNYVAGVLSQYEGVVPYPAPPKIDKNAEPFHVLEAINHCLLLNRKIARKVKLSALVLDPAEGSEQASAEDSVSTAAMDTVRAQLRRAHLNLNYEAATLLLADVSYWTWKMDAEGVSPKKAAPKTITTPLVAQKARQLGAQLQSVLDNL